MSPFRDQKMLNSNRHFLGCISLKGNSWENITFIMCLFFHNDNKSLLIAALAAVYCFTTFNFYCFI